MNIRSLSLGGLPAACLSSRSTGSIVDHRASLMSKRKPAPAEAGGHKYSPKTIDGEQLSRIP